MKEEIQEYNDALESAKKDVCDKLARVIDANLNATENKLWHGHPVWFIDGNPIVGYSVEKPGVRLMFWSGESFDEPGLQARPGGKFKDASVFYNEVAEINEDDVKRWLEKSENIQWNYRDIVKHKGKLERLK